MHLHMHARFSNAPFCRHARIVLRTDNSVRVPVLSNINMQWHRDHSQIGMKFSSQNKLQVKRLLTWFLKIHCPATNCQRKALFLDSLTIKKQLILPFLFPMLKRRQIIAAGLCIHTMATPKGGSYLRYIVQCNVSHADWLRLELSKDERK